MNSSDVTIARVKDGNMSSQRYLGRKSRSKRPSQNLTKSIPTTPRGGKHIEMAHQIQEVSPLEADPKQHNLC